MSASADGTCRLWNITSGASVVLPGLGASVAGNKVVTNFGNKRRNQMAQRQGAGLWQYKAAVLADDGVTLYTLETSRWVR